MCCIVSYVTLSLCTIFGVHVHMHVAYIPYHFIILIFAQVKHSLGQKTNGKALRFRI